MNESWDNFNDKQKISAYANESIALLKKLEIIIGKENNMFKPKDNVTRAEAATIAYKLLKKMN